jgi:hypothetical protein
MVCAPNRLVCANGLLLCADARLVCAERHLACAWYARRGARPYGAAHIIFRADRAMTTVRPAAASPPSAARGRAGTPRAGGGRELRSKHAADVDVREGNAEAVVGKDLVLDSERPKQ